MYRCDRSIPTSFWLLVTYTLWVTVSTCTRQRLCKHAFTVTMSASDWDSMSGLFTSAQKSFQYFLFMAQALLFWLFPFTFIFFSSGWKDAFCSLSASCVERHKRCWPHGVRLGFQICDSAQNPFKKTHRILETHIHRSGLGGTQVSLEGRCGFVLWFPHVQWTSIKAQQSDVSCYTLVLCHIIVVFNAPSLLHTEPLQLHLHSSFTLEIGRIIGGWFIKKSSTKHKQKSKV